MADTCAYRAAGSDAAAKAIYEYYTHHHSPLDSDFFPSWENTPENGKEYWRRMFRAAHKAYRDVIKAERSTE